MFKSLYNILHMSMLYVVCVSVVAVQPKKVLAGVVDPFSLTHLG